MKSAYLILLCSAVVVIALFTGCGKRADMRKNLVFIGLTFLLSWLLIVVYAVSGGEWVSKKTALVGTLYMWIPGLIAIWLLKFVYGEPVKSTLALYFKPNRWFFAAFLIPAVIVLATNEVGLMLPWHEYSPEMAGFYKLLEKTLTTEQVEQVRLVFDKLPLSVFWVFFLTGLIRGITVNVVLTLGEEIAWRGFLQNQLSHLNFWKSSLLIGVIWGVWHAPIILMGHNYPEHRIYGVGMMVVFCLLIAPLHSFVRLKSGSVLAAAIFHGTINGLAGVPLIMVVGGNDLTLGLTGLAGFIVLFIANLFITIFDRFISDEPVMFAIEGGGEESVTEPAEQGE